MKIAKDGVSKNDLMFFQNEVLGDIKQIDNKLTSKLEDKSNELLEKILNTEKKISLLSTQITELFHSFANSKSLEDKISQFLTFKQKTEQTIFIHDSKIQVLEKDVNNSIYKYDNIITNTILVPGLIGNSCKYPSVRAFLDYSNRTFKDLLSFKEKNIVDLKLYKNKLENLIQQFSNQIENIQNKFVEFVFKKINELEIKLFERIKITDDRIDLLRLENGKYANELVEESNKIKIDWEKLNEFENRINEKLNNEIYQFQNLINNTNKKVIDNQNEFKLIKQKFTKLSEFIKDVRFRKNLGQNIQSKEFKNFSKKIDFSKKNKLNDSISNDSFDSLKFFVEDDEKKNSPKSLRYTIRKANSFYKINDKKENNDIIEHKIKKSKRASMFNVATKFNKKKKMSKII